MSTYRLALVTTSISRAAAKGILQPGKRKRHEDRDNQQDTKRQYASYYHILETVAMGDEPEVGGVAGLRPWRALASDFCYKTRAFKTLSRLVSGLKAQKVLLSYSSEGHICMEDMKAELSKIGEFTMHPLGAIGRYRPNKVASSTASDVNEFLVVVERPMAQLSKTQPKIIKATNPILVESHA